MAPKNARRDNSNSGPTPSTGATCLSAGRKGEEAERLPGPEIRPER